jgi:hypothetical protein
VTTKLGGSAPPVLPTSVARNRSRVRTARRVDPIVLDRLAPELVDDARVDDLGQRRRQPERAGEGRRVGGVLVERAQRELADFARGLRLER